MNAQAIRRTAALAIAASLMAGCSSLPRDSVTVGSVPDDYRTRHPIVLTEAEQALDIPVASGATSLNMAVKSNITAFASAFAQSGTGVLHMLVPSGSPNAAAVAHVTNDIYAAIEEGGGSRDRVAVQSYDARSHGAAAPVRLSYASVTAQTGNCGAWPEDLSRSAENRNHADFGCSMQKNLAAIVANPGDLLGPRQESPIDAAQRETVIKTYQEGQ